MPAPLKAYPVLCLLLLLGISGVLAARPGPTGFLNRRLTVAGTSYRYQVYVPADFYLKKGQQWPIILFMHGAGERGTDGLAQTQAGLPASIREHPERWPALVVMPQCPAERYWTEPAMQEMALATLAQEQKAFRSDPARVYVTGLSMGGYGSWLMAAQQPAQFAAVVPICGGAYLPGHRAAQFPAQPPGLYETIARGIGSSAPVWAFHGADDSVVPVAETRQLVAALQAAGGTVQYTEYPGVDHNSWTQAYNEAALATWLFQQRRTNRK
ncbi:MAG: prolyl oligopeptidase family serine peptidase [Hymenobacter sp.]|nr:prolyl oligopeptidase family serine peptidase [Hymenobacter sp.]